MIHPTAIIHPKTRIGAECEVGPYCVLVEGVELGDRCRLHSHVVIEGHTRLGVENEIFPFAVIGARTQDMKFKGGATRVEIGNHNTIRECATIHSATNDGDATVIGDHNLLLCYCHIAHDCKLGNHIIISGYGGLAGHIIVEDHAIVSGCSAVHQFCRIGRMSIIGGCSKVVQDVPPYMLADGNPAETRTINRIGLERQGVPEETITALRQAYKILFRENLTTANALTRIEAELPPLPEVQHLVNFIRTSERGISK